MTDRLISLQAAVDAIKEMCEHYTPTKSVTHPHMDFVLEELNELPEAVIRCKDCKHWNELTNMCGKTHRLALGANGFCSRAEQKDGEAE